MDSGAARNRSGVEETACSEGRSGNWGDPTAPVVEVDSHGSMPWYKATPKSRVVRRESERAIVCAGRCMFLAGESPAGPFSKRGP